MNAIADRTLPAIAPLTKEQIRALRTANDVSIFHNPFAMPEDKQHAMIRVTKKIKAPAGYKVERETEAVMEIGVWSNLRHYSASESKGGITAESNPCGFSMISYADHSAAWQTIVSLLKEGDRIELEWDADCYGPDSSLRRAGMSMDRLTLVIRRGDKKMTFLLDDWAGEMFSRSRLICPQLWGR